MSPRFFRFVSILAAAAALLCLALPAAQAHPTFTDAGIETGVGTDAGAGAEALARALITAYPDAGMELARKPDGLYIRLSGRDLLFSPTGGCPEGHPDQPPDSPLCTMFTLAYPSGQDGRHPEPGFDPGRTRSERLLRLLYGDDKDTVAKQCVPVAFLGETLPFNRRHGAAAALARVSARLETLAADPAIRAYVRPTAGTFFWRVIRFTSRGADRLSAHAFAIAIDLNPDRGLYWGWRPGRTAVERVRRTYPQAVVDAFEAEGFIWGGKWHAFDFMHFEYRPELLPERFKDAPRP